MEEHFKRVEFGVASHQRQRRHSLSCQTEEIRSMDAQKSVMRGREKQWRRSTNSWRLPEAEMPAMPEQAMEFLSRAWSPCSTDLLQILSPACTSRLTALLLGSASSAPEDGEPADEASQHGDGDGDEENKNTVRLEQARGQSLLDATRVPGAAVVARGTPPRAPLPRARRSNKLITPRPTWQLNAGHMMRAILRGFLLSIVSVTGSQQRRRRRRDELRLHAAQAHAAVSVAQLAAAVAGMVSACELRPPPAAGARSSAADPVASEGHSGRTGAALASAAALVATVCAEAAAVSGRIHTARVASAVRAGRESRSTAELLALTAAAATSLRGAAALELRAADVRGVGGTNSASAGATSLQKGTTLRVCLPCGRVRVRTVAIFPHVTVVVLRLGKKLLRGALITYEEYEVLAAVSDGGGEAVVEGRPLFPLALSTTGGAGATVQLLFEHQAHCKVWTASVQGMLSEQKLKHPHELMMVL